MAVNYLPELQHPKGENIDVKTFSTPIRKNKYNYFVKLKQPILLHYHY